MKQLLWACGLILLGVAATSTSAQDALKDWLDFKKGQGGLAVFYETPVREFIVRDEHGRVLDAVDWNKSEPFLRQYRLVPGKYAIQFAGGNQTEVDVKEGELSYLQSVPFAETKWMTWTDLPSDKIKGALEKLEASGDAELISPVELNSDSKVLNFNTDPPWPIEPPKPK